MSAAVEQSDSQAEDRTEDQGKLAGYVAEFPSTTALMKAASETRDAGFKAFDCYVPFPVHGIDEAMGIKPTRLPYIVVVCAAIGATIAVLLQWYTNAFDYKYIISGKPFFSIPASVPIVFELTVLFSAFGALLGMFALNKLPQFYNRLFMIDPFLKATSSGFFLGIESEDPKFHEEHTKDFLTSLGSKAIVPCIEPIQDTGIPKVLFPIAGCLLLFGLVPLVIIAKMRVVPSNVPRIELIHDMDFQPKLKTQRFSRMFSDGRGMRLPIVGTIARGDLELDTALYAGLDPEKADRVDRSLLLPNAKNPDGTSAKLDIVPWVTEIPIPVDEDLMARGQERYDIYCAVCHGQTGKGDGLVTQRALSLQAAKPSVGSWVIPVSLYSDPVRKQSVGQLFNTITHGVRKMPSYGPQIPVEDRWAIVLYLRALQESGSGKIKDAPQEIRKQLNDLREELKAKAKE